MRVRILILRSATGGADYCAIRLRADGNRNQRIAGGVKRVDSGSTTRRATVHSLRSGLKIESLKTREGPRVIIFRPWLEKHGSSDATAMVQLMKDARNKAGSAACNHFWSRNRIHFPASCEEPFRSEFDHAPCISFYFGFLVRAHLV